MFGWDHKVSVNPDRVKNFVMRQSVYHLVWEVIKLFHPKVKNKKRI